MRTLRPIPRSRSVSRFDAVARPIHSWVIRTAVPRLTPSVPRGPTVYRASLVRVQGLSAKKAGPEDRPPYGRTLLTTLCDPWLGGRPPAGAVLHGEFDPGSGRTLAACLTHASGATNQASAWGRAANG